MQMKLLGLIVLATLLLAAPVAAQERGSLSLSVNVLQLLLGAANIEIEYQPVDAISVTGFVEYLLFDYAIDRARHPDLVTRLGIRYHHYFGDTYTHSLELEANGGYVYSRLYPALSGFTAGTLAGYRYYMTDNVYLLPRLMTNFLFTSYNTMMGFEGLIGYSWHF